MSKHDEQDGKRVRSAQGGDSMEDVERYERLIMSALEAQQLKIELDRKFRIIAQNLTASELKSRKFNGDAASKAFDLIKAKGVVVGGRSNHVKAQAEYKDVIVFLYCAPNSITGDAVSHVLEKLKSVDILNAV